MKALVLLSGGLDSATCLGLCVKKYENKNVFALCSYYGQKHKKEIECARYLAGFYGVEMQEIDLERIMKTSNCSLLSWSDQKIEHSSYGEQIAASNGSPVETYVPFRNGLFISAAAAIGLSRGCSEIWYGAHADDAAGAAYPDCSPVFIEYMNRAIYEGSGRQIELVAPFGEKTKADIVAAGLEIGVPYEHTWSCYEGGDKPCGKCGTCIDRQKAFEKNGAVDPLLQERK